MAPIVRLSSIFSLLMVAICVINRVSLSKSNPINSKDKLNLISFASPTIDKSFPIYNIVNSTTPNPPISKSASIDQLQQHDRLIIMLELLRQLSRMERLAKQRQQQQQQQNSSKLNNGAKKRILILELKSPKNTNTSVAETKAENELIISRMLTLILIASAFNRHLEEPNRRLVSTKKSFSRNRRELSHDRLKGLEQRPLPIYSSPSPHIVGRGPQIFLPNNEAYHDHRRNDRIRESDFSQNNGRHDPTNDRYDGDPNNGPTPSSEDLQQRINQNPYLAPHQRPLIHPLLLQQPSPYLSSPYHRRPVPPPILIPNQNANNLNDNQEQIIINQRQQEEQQQLPPLSPIHHMILAARNQQLAAMEYERRRLGHAMEQRRKKEQERQLALRQQVDGQHRKNGHQNPDENVRFDDDSPRENNSQQQGQQNQYQDQPENNNNNQEVDNRNNDQDDNQGQNENQINQLGNQNQGQDQDQRNVSERPIVNTLGNSLDNNTVQPNNSENDNNNPRQQEEKKNQSEVSNQNNSNNSNQQPSQPDTNNNVSNNETNTNTNNNNNNNNNADNGENNSNNASDGPGTDEGSNNNDESNGNNQQNDGPDDNGNDSNPENNQSNQEDDPDIQNFQNLAGDSDFTDLFPPGLLSENDIKDIRKQQEEQKKKQEEEEERRRQQQQQGNEDQNNQQQDQANNGNEQSQGATEDNPSPGEDNNTNNSNNTNSNNSKSDELDARSDKPVINANNTQTSQKLEPKVNSEMNTKTNATDYVSPTATKRTDSIEKANSTNETKANLHHQGPIAVNQLLYPLYTASNSEIYQNVNPVSSSKDFQTFKTNQPFEFRNIMPDEFDMNPYMMRNNYRDNDIDRSDSDMSEVDITSSGNRNHHRSHRKNAEPAPYSYLTSLFNFEQLHRQFGEYSDCCK